MSDASLELIALAATTSAADVDALVDRALADGRIAAIVVPPAFARRAVIALREHAIDVASVVGFPLGLGKATVKAIEATSLAKDDVTGLAVAPLAANPIAGNLDAFRQELLEIARGARAAKAGIELSVRIDVDWPRLDLAAIGAAVLRGAFDGVALVSADRETLAAAVATMRRVEGLKVAAIAADAGWMDALLVAGAHRVGIAAS